MPRVAKRRHPASWFHDLHIRALGRAEDGVHYCVVLVLMAVATIVLYHTTYELITSHQPVAQAATTAVNGVLFAIIIMEVMRTVMAHFERGGLQLPAIPDHRDHQRCAGDPFRWCAPFASKPGYGRREWHRHLALMELAVNGAVVFGLAASLVLIRRLAAWARRAQESTSNSLRRRCGGH